MLNKAILMGRLVADPELRQTPNGNSVTTFTIAVNRDYGKAGEQRPTDFIDIVAWRNTADFVSKYFTKGMQVAVSGSIQTRTWKDKQDNTRKSVEIVAENVYFADSKKDGAAPRSESFDAPKDSFGLPSFESENNNFSDLSENDDDLPF